MSMWICSSIRALNSKRHDHQQDFVSKCTGINLIRKKAVQVASVRAAFYIGTSHHAAPRLDQSPSRTETEIRRSSTTKCPVERRSSRKSTVEHMQKGQQIARSIPARAGENSFPGASENAQWILQRHSCSNIEFLAA